MSGLAGDTIRVPVSMKLALFFTANPDEELTALDVIDKFGSESDCADSIRNKLDAWVVAGYFGRVATRGAGSSTVYSAGPEILKLVRLPA